MCHVMLYKVLINQSNHDSSDQIMIRDQSIKFWDQTSNESSADIGKKRPLPILQTAYQSINQSIKRLINQWLINHDHKPSINQSTYLSRWVYETKYVQLSVEQSTFAYYYVTPLKKGGYIVILRIFSSTLFVQPISRRCLDMYL